MGEQPFVQSELKSRVSLIVTLTWQASSISYHTRSRVGLVTCAMRLVARMADDMGINIQVGRYSTVSINLSNILEFYLVVVENSSFMHPYYRRRKVFVSLASILFVVVFRQKYSQIQAQVEILQSFDSHSALSRHAEQLLFSSLCSKVTLTL